MKTKLLAITLLMLLSFSAFLTLAPGVFGATNSFGQTTQSGSDNAALNSILGARYTNTANSGQAQSISAYLSFAPQTGFFGEKNSGTLYSASIENRMRGQAFTTGVSYPVVATSIGARIYVAMEHTVKAAIYTESGQLVASSNAITLDGWNTDDRTFTLTTQPVLAPYTTYFIVVWGNSVNGDVKLLYNENTGNSRVADQNYQSSWPASVTNFNYIPDRNHFIWCNYQSAAAVQCAIYSVDGATLLGVTEQKTLTTSSGWTTFNFNTKPTLNANTQYVLAAWSSNPAVKLYYTGTTTQAFTGSGASFPASLTASGTRNYNLYCTTQYNTITASAGSNGNINPSGNVNVAYGSSQSFSITPNIGYHIADVVIDGTTSVGAVSSYTFPSVTMDRSIAASFAINTYTLTVTQGPHGTITPGTTTVNYGSSQTFDITPETGYHIVDVSVDGSSVGAVTQYTLSNIDASHTITASFALTQVPTTLTVECTPDTVDKTGSMDTVVSGFLTTSGGSPIAGQTIVLTYNDGATQEIGTATTQADGSYSYSWTVPSNLANGFYLVSATFTGDDNPYMSSTAQTANGGGLFVVPEYALGGLAALFACIAAFGIVRIRKTRSPQ